MNNGASHPGRPFFVAGTLTFAKWRDGNGGETNEGQANNGAQDDSKTETDTSLG